ncbi:unnamed protein product [Brassica oleracea]|uniref:choline-phosphate cytidylyltransferase 2-like n=1 Tax=Brassica oleracea var. oleracea TaxID=109376 RepID=UPI0006A6C67E|nr:PREDICTED: choline-phosphate cytidylyltransferase 2-like [Brassica oleracea var. oleracea]
MASSRVVFSDLKSSPQNRKNKFYQIQTVKRLHNEWIENTYRWVTGFLEIFEEGFIRRGLQSEGVFKRGESENSQKQTGEWDEYKDERHYARVKMLKKRKRKLLRRMQKTTKSFHS